MDALAPAPHSHLAVPRRLLRLRSDAALAERYAQGDETAFSVLFERHRASVLAVCMGVLGSRHDAEDAAQESFAALAVTLRSAPPRELRAWLARVARNAAIDAARRRRARITSDAGEVTDDRPMHVGDVHSSHDAKDEFASLLEAIRELPESQRTALLMRELAGHSYREIGDLLELDEEAVRGLIARARVGLRARREATELPCSSAREAIATEPDGRRHDKTVRRHIRGCASCRAYRHSLRDDARALRGLVAAAPTGGMAGGGAVVGLAAKGALLGTAATQVTAACAVSICAVGGIVLLSPGLTARHRPAAAASTVRPSTSGSHRHHRPATPAPGSSRSLIARSGSARAAGSSGGALPHRRAHASLTVVVQSRLAVAHTGSSTTGRASTTTGGRQGSGGGGPSAPSPPPTGGSAGASGATGTGPTHAGAPVTPTGTSGTDRGPWPDPSSGTSGAADPSAWWWTRMGSTPLPRTYGAGSGSEVSGGSSGSTTGWSRRGGDRGTCTPWSGSGSGSRWGSPGSGAGTWGGEPGASGSGSGASGSGSGTSGSGAGTSGSDSGSSCAPPGSSTSSPQPPSPS